MPLLRFQTGRSSVVAALPGCLQGEWEPLHALSPAPRAEWRSSLRLDQPAEGVRYIECKWGARGCVGPDDLLVSTEQAVTRVRALLAAPEARAKGMTVRSQEERFSGSIPTPSATYAKATNSSPLTATSGPGSIR